MRAPALEIFRFSIFGGKTRDFSPIACTLILSFLIAVTASPARSGPDNTELIVSVIMSSDDGKIQQERICIREKQCFIDFDQILFKISFGKRNSTIEIVKPEYRFVFFDGSTAAIFGIERGYESFSVFDLQDLNYIVHGNNTARFEVVVSALPVK